MASREGLDIFLKFKFNNWHFEHEIISMFNYPLDIRETAFHLLKLFLT